MTIASGPSNSARPRVTVWRENLLALSETFIAQQVTSFTRYDASLRGLRWVEGGLAPVAGVDCQIGGGRLARRVLSARQLDWVARTAKPHHGRSHVDHVHFTTDASLLLPLLSRRSSPLVVTAHGYDVCSDFSSSNDVKNRALVRRWRLLVSRVDIFVAVSEFISSQLRARGVPRHKIRVLPIGVTVRSTSPVQIGTPGLGSVYDIVFVGRLVEKKGCDDLLRAAASLGGIVRVAVAGDGPDRAALEDLAVRSRLRVDFLGALSSTEVRSLMHKGAIFVGPSKTASDGDREGFGMVFLEAALAGMPVVSYRSGGVPEAVVDGVTGVLVEESDWRALAHAIGSLLMDRRRREALGINGRARVLREFDVTKCSGKLERLYDELLASDAG